MGIVVHAARAGFVGIAIAALASGCQPRQGAAPAANPTAARGELALAGFERIRRLTGAWEGTINRIDSLPALARFELTAKGTAVIERVVIEDPVDMVSVYYLSDSSLVMAHFCAAGNQPQMILSYPRSPDSLSFALVEGSNLARSRELHMRGKQLLLEGDRLRIVWETYAEGRMLSTDTMFLRRRAGG